MASASTSCTPFSAWKRARALAAPAPPCHRGAARSGAGHAVSPYVATALGMGAAGGEPACSGRPLARQRAEVPAPACCRREGRGPGGGSAIAISGALRASRAVGASPLRSWFRRRKRTDALPRRALPLRTTTTTHELPRTWKACA